MRSEEHEEFQPLLPEVTSILETLLAQAEQPERKQVVRARLNKRDHSWYFSGHRLGLRYEVNEQLQLLAAKGWLRLHWQKYEEGNLLEAVDLVTQQRETLDGLYALLERVPLNMLKEKLRQLLSSTAKQEASEGWFSSFLSWAISQLAANRSPAPLSLSNLQESQDLLRSLSAIARLNTPTLERTLSVQLFGNSKRLEQLRGGVLTVLRAHSPGASSYGDDDWALLQAHNMYRPSTYVPFAGPLELVLKHFVQGDRVDTREAVHLQLDPHLPSISLSEDVLRAATIISCPATALITVENLTSFSELLFVRPPSVIIVCTSFASPALVAFLSRISAFRPDLPFVHWGDLDAGGLRILAHLRQHLGTVLPLGMDVETFEAYRTYAQPLTANDRASFNALLADPILADCTALINHLLTVGLKLEQEAVSAERVMEQIRLL